MKEIVLFLVAFSLSFNCAYGEGNAGNRTISGTYAIGDGNILLYGKRSDILQFFGPPYSSPSILHLTLAGKDSVISDRSPGTAIWTHRLVRNGKQIVQLTDFISSKAGSFIRTIDADEQVEYELDVTLDPFYLQYNDLISVTACDQKEKLAGSTQSYTIHLQKRIPYYFVYLAPRGYTYRIMISGAARLVPLDSTNKKFRFIASKGKSSLVFVSGPSEEDVVNHLNVITSNTLESLLKDSEKQWKEFSSKLSVFSRENYPEEITDAIDDISILLKCQQSAQGVVMAGYSWHMGYIRDQYGAFRGLIAMGLYKEAQQTLNFFYDVWKENGFIRNAQAIGFPGLFHCHENDEVEITGYLMVQAFQYYAKTKDAVFVEKIMPMLEWAMKVQIRNLIDGMLPFNGDETYIAGGVLPRKVMYNGSADATLLFIEGSSRLMNFVRERKLWDEKRIQDNQNIIEDCISRYRANFFRNGILYANNIERESKVSYPETRSGVCLHPDHPVSYHVKLYHFKGPLYFCADCMKKDNSRVQVPEPEVFDIPSVGLFPIYIDAKLFSEQEKKVLLEKVINRYQSPVKLPIKI